MTVCHSDGHHVAAFHLVAVEDPHEDGEPSIVVSLIDIWREEFPE